MKVIIDISPLKTVHKTRGIGIYTRQLVDALQKNDPESRYILTSKPQEYQADLIHYPYFDFFSRTLPRKKRVKTVVTIHDTIPLVFPKHYKPGMRGKLNSLFQIHSLKTVNAIITDSHNSKKDIGRYLHQSKEKIHVVHLAADSTFKKMSREEISEMRIKYKLPNKYALYVGDVNYNKNIVGLIEGTSLLEEPLPLVLVAKAMKDIHIKEAQEIQSTITRLSMESRVHILTAVPLEPLTDLAAIYSGAFVYIQPSLYEGFGLPILEAMACGTPVVCSNTSSLPEVAGEAAIYINPEDKKSIKDAFETMLHQSPSGRKQMVEAGLKQVKKFSWDRTAQATVNVYESVLA